MKMKNELRQEQRRAEQKAWEAKKAEEKRLADEAEENEKPWMEEIATWYLHLTICLCFFLMVFIIAQLQINC